MKGNNQDYVFLPWDKTTR